MESLIRSAWERAFIDWKSFGVSGCGLISAGSVFCPAVKLDDLVNLFLSSVKASLSISSCVSE